MTTPVQVAIVYHSGYGHTARQAQAVARELKAGRQALAELKAAA